MTDREVFLALAISKARTDWIRDTGDRPDGAGLQYALDQAAKKAEREWKRDHDADRKWEKKTVPIDGVVPEPSLPSFTAALEAADAVVTLVGKLPEKQALVVIALFLEGMTRREVAESLGVSPKTVSRHRDDAFQRLRAILQKIS